jgi:hypothetical protein
VVAASFLLIGFEVDLMLTTVLEGVQRVQRLNNNILQQ